MKTVSVSEAKNRLGKLLDEVLNGHPVVVVRGKRRVILKPLVQSDADAGWAEFQAVFPPAPAEPRDAVARIRRAISRVRRDR